MSITAFLCTLLIWSMNCSPADSCGSPECRVDGSWLFSLQRSPGNVQSMGHHVVESGFALASVWDDHQSCLGRGTPGNSQRGSCLHSVRAQYEHTIRFYPPGLMLGAGLRAGWRNFLHSVAVPHSSSCQWWLEHFRIVKCDLSVPWTLPGQYVNPFRDIARQSLDILQPQGCTPH